MKKVLLSILCIVMLGMLPTSAKAQLCNPYYAMYYGYGYMPVANGYYIGQIAGGYPHGNGYVYYYDMNFGWVAYQGGFYGGLAHGNGECLCSFGYVRGVWNRDTFVQQINVSQQQIQQSYNNIMQQSYNYAPQNSNTISLPPGTEIKEIESSSELGRKLLGKMRK